MLNLACLLEDTARRHPSRDAVVLGDQRLDYRSIDAAANQVAHLLTDRADPEREVRPGSIGVPIWGVEELLSWGREQMAAYKYPRLVEIVDSLPMTSTGKILKRELVGAHADALR